MGIRQASPRLALQRDVNKIYRQGLPKNVEREQMPAVAAFAESVSKEKDTNEPGYLAGIIEKLLHRAIGAAAVSLVHTQTPNTRELRLGLQELFDVGSQPEHVSGLEDRLSNAADKLPYKNGGSLKKAMRGEEKFTELICHKVGTALTVIADQENFTYTTTLSTDEPDGTWLDAITERGTLPDGEQALTVFYVGRTLYDELTIFFTYGLEAVALNSDLIPTIAAIAKLATSPSRNDRAELTESALETVLTWALSRTSSRIDFQGACELFGLGKARGLESAERLERAAARFGHESAERFVYSMKLAAVLTFTRDQLLKLTAEMTFWPVT